MKPGHAYVVLLYSLIYDVGYQLLYRLCFDRDVYIRPLNTVCTSLKMDKMARTGNAFQVILFSNLIVCFLTMPVEDNDVCDRLRELKKSLGYFRIRVCCFEYLFIVSYFSFNRNINLWHCLKQLVRSDNWRIFKNKYKNR